MSDNLTPMMRQYLEIKKECEGAILFFRLGDFYEMFFEDAVEASRILHITLTSRGQHKGVKVPMCGVPHHAAENYIARLIKSGKKVAVCEQIEEAAEEGKKIFGRRIARIVTPGTFIAEGFSTEASNSYIMSLNFNSCGFGIAYADISTGEFRLTEVDSTERLFPEIYKICPAETIIPKSFRDSAEMKEIREAGLGTITIREDWTFNSLTAEEELRRQFEVKTLESFGCSAMGSGIGAAGALLRYLKDTQKNSLGNVRSMRVYNVTEYMTLDRVSHRHLELVENQEDLTSSGTLYEVLDKTKTPMGKRELKRWLLNPLLDTVKISERLDAVEFFHDNNQVRVDTREILDGMYDIERLANKVALGTANPRDMLSLADSLEKVGMMVKLSKEKFPGSLADMASGMEDFFSVIADKVMPEGGSFDLTQR
nr:DNA mismatch repair protein MutS [Candidatus Omnitrophota bacterium]